MARASETEQTQGQGQGSQPRHVPVSVECTNRQARQLVYAVKVWGVTIHHVRRQRSAYGNYHVYVSDRLKAGDGFPVEYLDLDELKAHARTYIHALVKRHAPSANKEN